MTQYRVITSIGTTYIVHADTMVPFQGPSKSDVAFMVERPRHGSIVSVSIAYVTNPVFVYEVGSVDFDPDSKESK